MYILCVECDGSLKSLESNVNQRWSLVGRVEASEGHPNKEEKVKTWGTEKIGMNLAVYILVSVLFKTIFYHKQEN